MVVAVYGTARVSIFVIGASGSGPLKASRSVRRGVWRPPCAWRVRSNPALPGVLLFAPSRRAASRDFSVITKPVAQVTISKFT